MFAILIVEDNRTFRQSLKDILTARYPFMNIQEASNGLEALQIVKMATPDLIFMNIRLPGENGLQITKRLKRDHPQVPVAILTDYDLAEYRDAAHRYGANFFITKGSSTWEDITSLVESVMSASRLCNPDFGTED